MHLVTKSFTNFYVEQKFLKNLNFHFVFFVAKDFFPLSSKICSKVKKQFFIIDLIVIHFRLTINPFWDKYF